MEKAIRLHHEVDLDEEWQKRSGSVRAICAALSEEVVMSSDIDELSKEMAARFLFNPPVLDWDRIEADEPEFSDVGEYASVSLHIPCKGDTSLLGVYHRNMHYQSTQPEYQTLVTENSLIIRINTKNERLTKTTETARKAVRELVESYLPGFVDSMVSHRNPRIIEAARIAIEEKKKEFNKKNQVAAEFSSLFPIRKRTDQAAQVFTPVARKVIVVPQNMKPSEINNALEMKHYNDILDTIGAMARGIERSPKTFQGMDEEDIRMILLIGLNAIYEGQATAETFNGEGKTDILIRVADKTIFIAECLVWKGKDYLQGKMNEQLFQYAMWNDTKTALIVFNRNKDFTGVINTMREMVNAHPQRIRELDGATETSSRYLFRRHDDPEKIFYVTCLAFNVPA